MESKWEVASAGVSVGRRRARRQQWARGDPSDRRRTDHAHERTPASDHTTQHSEVTPCFTGFIHHTSFFNPNGKSPFIFIRTNLTDSSSNSWPFRPEAILDQLRKYARVTVIGEQLHNS